jgi:hypothetical protein
MGKRRPPKAHWQRSLTDGRARCQHDVSEGVQCPKPARPGYLHCARHGGGSPLQDQSSTHTVAQRRGARAATILDYSGVARRELYARYPVLRAFFDRYAKLPMERVADFRDVINEIRALMDWQSQFPTLTPEEYFAGRLATLSRGIEAIERAGRAQQAMQDVDGELRLRMAQLLQPVLIGLEQLIIAFVPVDQRTAALTMLREVVTVSLAHPVVPVPLPPPPEDSPPP